MDPKDMKILKIMGILGAIVVAFIIFIMMYVFIFDDHTTDKESNSGSWNFSSLFSGS